MKFFYIFFGTTAVIGFVAIAWYFASSAITPAQPTDIPVTFPVTQDNTIRSTIPDQTESEGTQPDIARAFQSQIDTMPLITLGGTTVVSMYALQSWGDENTAGEALLKYDSSRGWVLIALGGGAWKVSSLMEFGVPQLYAEQLIAGRKE